MKNKLAVMFVGLLAAGAVSADNGYESDNNYSAKGRVLKINPSYETVRVNYPEQRCWNERVRHRSSGGRDSYTPMIAGAIVGGVVGNQFGKGKGKDIMTAAGALLGGSVGNDMGRKSYRRGYTTNERRCETVDNFQEKRELTGYDVKYKYDGRTFWTRTDQRPGRYIDLAVSVAPTGGTSYNFRDYE